MKFERIDGKMTLSNKPTKVLTWTMPDPITGNEKRKMASTDNGSVYKSKDVVAKSSVLASSGLVLLTASSIDIKDGLFWSVFMEYLYPWFVDLATVYAAIRIAMSFYEEQRGGRDSKNGFGAFITYGKWLLLFHLIPFFVKLIDTVGQRMADSL